MAEEGVVEVRNSTPKAKLIDTTFRDKTVNVRIPFKVAAKSMEDTDKARHKMSGVVQVIEETGDDLINSREEQG